MKKIIVILAIACGAAQLYANDGVSLDKQIELIKSKKDFYTMNKLEAFTVVMGILEQRYPEYSREEIAMKFGDTPIAQAYVNTNRQFMDSIRNQCNPQERLDAIEYFLYKGADVNFTTRIGNGFASVLGVAYMITVRDKEADTQAVELLLNSGAQPNAKHLDTTLLNAGENIAKSRCKEYRLLELLKKHNNTSNAQQPNIRQSKPDVANIQKSEEISIKPSQQMGISKKPAPSRRPAAELKQPVPKEPVIKKQPAKTEPTSDMFKELKEKLDKQNKSMNPDEFKKETDDEWSDDESRD